MPLQRLDKQLADVLCLSRKEVKALIKQGRITVNARPATSSEQKVDPEADVIARDGVSLVAQSHLYLMLHKPAGIVSASRDPKAQTVIDLVPPQWRRKGLFPAGRLDKDTTGFVLITDDGPLAHAILSPRRHVEKSYLVTLDRPATAAMSAVFAAGVVLADAHTCRPALLEVLPGQMARVVLQEGMYHQIKRMFLACGAVVTALHRDRIGGLILDPSLPSGACRPITPDELAQLTQRL